MNETKIHLSKEQVAQLVTLIDIYVALSIETCDKCNGTGSVPV